MVELPLRGFAMRQHVHAGQGAVDVRRTVLRHEVLDRPGQRQLHR